MEDEKPKIVSSKKRFPLWAKITAIGIVIVIVLVLLVNGTTSGMTKASNDLVNDIQAQNDTAAYALFTKDAAATIKPADFKKMVGTVGSILNTQEKMTSKSINGQSGQAATGKVTYDINGTDNKTYTLTINLQKEDGNWKVLNFDSSVK